MRKRNHLTGILVIILFSCVIYAVLQLKDGNEVSHSPEPEAKILLRLANDLDKDHVSSQACDRFVRLVNEQSDGRIEIHMYHGGRLGSQAEAVEQLSFGGIDFARVGLMSLEEQVPAADALAVPYLFRNDAQLWAVLEGGVGKTLGSILEENGYVPLFYESAGFQSVYSTRPVRTLADLAGLRLRVPDNRIAQAAIGALGAVPVSMPWTEVYDALKNGVIDGAADNIVSYFQADHDTVAPFYTDSFHTMAPDLVIASKITFSELSPEDQALIRECGHEAGLWQRESWKTAEQEALAAAGDSAEALISPLQDCEAWKAAAGQCYEELLSPEALTLLENIRALLG